MLHPLAATHGLDRAGIFGVGTHGTRHVVLIDLVVGQDGMPTFLYAGGFGMDPGTGA